MKHKSCIFLTLHLAFFFRKGFFIIAVLPTAYYLLLVSHSALAQGIDLPTVSNLSTKPLADTAVSIINAFLGLVGIIALGIFVYGGYLWMFSAGDPKKLLLAKKVLISAVIGLIIILSSWAIVNFIINGATGGGEGAAPVVVAPPPLPRINVVVKWIDPKNDASDVPLCRIVQAGFPPILIPARSIIQTLSFKSFVILRTIARRTDLYLASVVYFAKLQSLIWILTPTAAQMAYSMFPTQPLSIYRPANGVIIPVI